MAPHRAFWVIVQGSTPTAFRARRAEDLLPTLHQLQRTQPDTYLRWFDRGRFWESPEAEREAFLASRHASSSRKADWRPGGDHADPRARFKLTRDEKRARFKARQRRDWDRGEADTERKAPSPERPGGDRPKWGGPKRQAPGGERPRGDRPKWGGPKRQPPGGERREGAGRPRSEDRPKWGGPGSRAPGDGRRPKWGSSERREPGGESRKRPWKPKPGGSRSAGGSGSSRPPGRFPSRGPRRPKGPRGPKGSS